jgi:hypothetical protein
LFAALPPPLPHLGNALLLLLLLLLLVVAVVVVAVVVLLLVPIWVVSPAKAEEGCGISDETALGIENM